VPAGLLSRAGCRPPSHGAGTGQPKEAKGEEEHGQDAGLLEGRAMRGRKASAPKRIPLGSQ